MCYDGTQLSSLEAIEKRFLPAIKKVKTKASLFVLANKADLKDSKEHPKWNCGTECALKIGATYHELSTKTGHGLDSLF